MGHGRENVCVRESQFCGREIELDNRKGKERRRELHGGKQTVKEQSVRIIVEVQ